jgi:hypothetical protein
MQPLTPAALELILREKKDVLSDFHDFFGPKIAREAI